MRYLAWLWRNSMGIRWNTVVRIVTGIGQVVLGLLMVWLSKRFIDETIRSGTADDVLRMVELLVLTVVGGVVLRQVGYWLKTSANVRQSNALRLCIFGRLFHRQLFTICITKHKPAAIVFLQELRMECQFERLLPKTLIRKTKYLMVCYGFIEHWQ